MAGMKKSSRVCATRSSSAVDHPKVPTQAQRSRHRQPLATAQLTSSKASWQALAVKAGLVLHHRRKNSQVSLSCLDNFKRKAHPLSTSLQDRHTTRLPTLSRKVLASMVSPWLNTP